jgi:hypothetical protein
MNAAISSVVRTQVSNSTATSKIESETAKSAERISGGMNNASETAVSSKYDTFELSRDYLEYKTQGDNVAMQDRTSQLNATILQPALRSGKKDVISSLDLYSYTDTELLEMVNAGSISQDQYDAELASREPSFAVGE